MSIIASGGANFIPIVKVSRHVKDIWLMADKAHHKLVVQSNAVAVPFLHNPVAVCSDPNVNLSLMLRWDEETYGFQVYYCRCLASIVRDSMQKDWQVLCCLANDRNMLVDEYLKQNDYADVEAVYSRVGRRVGLQTYYKIVGTSDNVCKLEGTIHASRVLKSTDFNVIIPENFVYTHFAPNISVLHTLDIRNERVVLRKGTVVECHILKVPKRIGGLNLEDVIVDDILCDGGVLSTKILRIPVNWNLERLSKPLTILVDELQLLTGKNEATAIAGVEPKIHIQAKRIIFESEDRCTAICDENVLRYRNMIITKK